jgi:hypothetical protein
MNVASLQKVALALAEFLKAARALAMLANEATNER